VKKENGKWKREEGKKGGGKREGGKEGRGKKGRRRGKEGRREEGEKAYRISLIFQKVLKSDNLGAAASIREGGPIGSEGGAEEAGKGNKEESL